MPELSALENKVASKNETQIVKAEKSLAAEYRAAYKSISVKLAELYEKMGEPPSLAEARRFGRLETLQKAIAAEYRALTKKGIETTEETSTDSFLDGAYGTRWAYDQATGVAIDWPVLSTNAIKASVYEKQDGKDFKARFKEWANEDYRRMNTQITQGLIKGYGYAKTAKALRGEISKSAYEAMRIVRTESGRAYTQGHLETYDEARRAGVKARKRWVATLDTRTRDPHAALDGTYADEEGLFHMDGESAEGPGLFGDPGLDINCRCRVVEEIEGFEPEFRRIRGEGIVEMQTFAQWASGRGWSKESGWPKGEK